MNENPGSITNAIRRLEDDSCSKAAEKLWTEFFERLCQFASTKIYQRHKRLISAEEIASDAFLNLMEGIKKRKFDNLNGRNQLWALLVALAARSASAQRRHHDRKKRGNGKVRGDSVFEELEANGFDYLAGAEGDQDLSHIDVVLKELLERLPDERYNTIALLRLEGYSNNEIATELDCSERTVERKLQAIRMIWERA